jgi:hypothetical protein
VANVLNRAACAVEQSSEGSRMLAAGEQALHERHMANFISPFFRIRREVL